MKYSDRMVIEFFMLVTCHRHLDRAEIVKKFIDDFHNFLFLFMGTSKKVVKILID